MPDSGRPDSGKRDFNFFKMPDSGKPDPEKPDSGKPDSEKPDSGKPDFKFSFFPNAGLWKTE